ncbi:very short patch repair endonuclease [Amycolatopsis sp. OK19-0408]|uniref:Very short patch repair endonuclease n=2 Tax=Amycolatopsis iheyensis TaxID=2945988 RepID=A0A9X2NGR5_9PSEU|nr:very short patch repair endonuclease [Amycolatopsis iheyensis]
MANRRRDTGPELALRSELHRRGMRFRVDYAALSSNRRRRADIVFTKAKIAVFVDGCFWHGCPAHQTRPAANSDYWRTKIETNQARDADTDQQLRNAGWTVLRFWEHEVATAAADVVESTLRSTLEAGIKRPQNATCQYDMKQAASLATRPRHGLRNHLLE